MDGHDDLPMLTRACAELDDHGRCSGTVTEHLIQLDVELSAPCGCVCHPAGQRRSAPRAPVATAYTSAQSPQDPVDLDEHLRELDLEQG